MLIVLNQIPILYTCECILTYLTKVYTFTVRL